MQIDVLFAFLTSVFFLTLSPGPDIIYVFYKSLTSGFKEAAKLSMGLTSGLLIHTLFVAFGISTLIKSNQVYFDLIKYFGFIYFAYLAFSQFFKKNRGHKKKNEIKNSFLTGLLMNLLNPKISIFFIAFLPAFVTDCLETLEEIAMEGKEEFIEAGGENYYYVPCLNDDDEWSKLIASWAN